MAKNGAYRELTLVSIVAGVLVGAVLNMGICYAGLQIGFTIVGSTVAAVIGFGILRGILRRGSILEVNVFQTVASSVNTVNAGIIFTVPVLFLLGRQEEIDYPALILASVAGSLLGVVMIVPLRKQIIDFERLRFPEGVATAAILKSPGAGVQKAKLLITSILVSATILALTKDLPLWEEAPLQSSYNVGELLGVPAGIRVVLAVSLLSLGAGYLAGRNGLVILYGTLLNFWVLIPICIGLGWVPTEFGDFRVGSDDYFRAGKFVEEFSEFASKPLGIGMILGGAIAGIVVAAPALRAALASLRATPVSGEREELPFRVINVGLAVGMALLLVATKLAAGDAIGWGTAVIVAVTGGIWLWLAGLVVAQTTGRTDWSPLSGLALIAIAIMMGIMGTEDDKIIPAVTVGAAICVATSMCADMMADLKTGYLVGSKPLRQQIAQISTCWIGPPIALLTVILLWNAYAFGPSQADTLRARAEAQGIEALREYEESIDPATDLPQGAPVLGAPQAAVLKSAIDIVQSGEVKLGKYLTGAAAGLLISLLVSPGLGVMIGLSLYLPFQYMIVFGLGGIANILVRRFKGARWAEDKGVPVAAGLIVGDALVGIIDAIARVLQGLGGVA